MNTRRILAGAAVALVAAGGGVMTNHWINRDSDVAYAAPVDNHQDAVKQLWGAAVTDVNGKPQSLSLLKGHPIVVNFWASWCGPCVEEMPELSQIQREYAKKGIQFVGLGVDSDKNIQAFLQKVKVAYPIYVIGFGGADLARAFGNNAGGLPFTVVIDAKGNIRSTKLGQIDAAALRKTLDTL
ncbi:TlpA family protein disulfide reductase [Paraburkholderia antibiotica]|uniref:TlpA family protein disulfide reductase n=1 Tax=Paraburkholderia antibiotica TaxID=2728839 RepID=A0A7X9X920_9BURK|nr:TlpA disulfide reductase family protein [Paraburkholderia antibiotica]NML33690.1 TlpA family protein disulfide reductase [Paraburkholderia antibiotica]